MRVTVPLQIMDFTIYFPPFPLESDSCFCEFLLTGESSNEMSSQPREGERSSLKDAEAARGVESQL